MINRFNNYVFIILLACLSFNAIGQDDCITKFQISSDTIIYADVIHDYFREECDSIIFLIGKAVIMPLDSQNLIGKNIFRVETTNVDNGSLKIYFKDRLLYQYQLWENNIEGVGYIYYPFTSRIAIQGEFKNSKLHGKVFVQNNKGEVLEVMKYRKGKYIKHLYHKCCRKKKSLRKISKGRSYNPLRNDEIIQR